MDQLTASRQVERIRALDDSWLEAARRHDLETMIAIYAPEATELLPGRPALVGRDAIREFYRGVLARYPRLDPAFSLDEVTIAESGDLAVVRGTYRFTLDTATPERVDAGKFVGVWIYTAGDWRLMINISNSDGQATG